MREANLLQQLHLSPLSHAEGGGRPFSYAVHGQDGCLLEGRAKESAGCVGKMVIAKQNLRGRDPQFFLNETLYPELIAQPGYHPLAKDTMGTRECLHIC